MGSGASCVTVSSNRCDENDISVMNSMHSRLARFLERFYGVATKHLQHYLDWLCCHE